MGKIANWITKIPRLKNSKVARFSYKAEAYANDDIEGVDSYDYSNDMNVPLATHTDFDGSVLSTGARANFSSIPKNGLNHFFGRVSYNLNKVIDFLSDFLDDFIALNDSFISFTEIVSFSSSATLSNYANGTTKRLLSTAGSTITITLPAGETYLGSNTITLAPSVMLTITKRGTVWVNSSGNAITADKWKTARNVTISDADGTNTGTAVSVDGSENETLKLPATIKATIAGRAKDSYPIPTDAVLQYSFDEIKQLPDNPTGTVYKRDNDWMANDVWATGSATASIVENKLSILSSSTTTAYILKAITATNKLVRVYVKRSNAGEVHLYGTIGGVFTLLGKRTIESNMYYTIDGYINGTTTNVQVYFIGLTSGNTAIVQTVYIGDGSYLEPVIDNSYSESHAENHGVIPVDGVCGKAGYFNNSYMIAPRPALGDDITVYFWAKFDALGTQTIVQSRTEQGQGLSVFQIDSKYRLDWRGHASYFYGYTPLVNTWHHVCMKMNATTKVLKINGEVKSTLTGTYGTTQNLASTIWSGLSGTGGTLSGDVFTGALDGLKIIPRFTTDDEDTGEYKARANHPKFYATADKLATARTINGVSFDGSANITVADSTKAPTSHASSAVTYGVSSEVNYGHAKASAVVGTANGTASKGTTPTIFAQSDHVHPLQTSVSGNAATADKWKTARNIFISDADGTNTGTAVSVDGSENETLKLPSTIKANVTGNAATASKANVRVSLRHGSHFFSKTWAGLTSFNGGNIWTDGENIYSSDGVASAYYVLNKATSTWSVKTWTGLTNFNGGYTWTDGENIYYSNGTTQYVLNKATSTWSVKTWTGLTNFTSSRVWTDGENIYYSFESANYVLNKATSTWSVKTWTGLTNFNGGYTWTDGENIYYSFESANYVLNKATSTWSIKTWTGLTNFSGYHVWTDGENIYYSFESARYVLNKATSTWSIKTWTGLSGLSSLFGHHSWTDGENIYYSFESAHYVLPATRHNYVDDTKYTSLFGTVTSCSCSTLSDRFVFRNE